MLTLISGAMVSVLLGAALTVPASVQEPECKLRDPNTGDCIVVVGRDPGPGRGPDDGDGGDGGTCRTTGGKKVPCYDPAHGWWLSGQDCYAQPADPPPPPESPVWDGKYPKGDVYLLFCPGPVFPDTCGGSADPEQDSGVCFVWFPQPPYSTLSAEELAEQVVDSMGLRGPMIGIVPEADDSSRGLVGMPVWMWTTVNDRTWGPNTASASSGPLTVTATAKAAHIDWGMGDGHTERCTTPGKPYDDSYGKQPSPDCGYRYEAASAYTVTGTTHWVVSWEASTGESGEITLDPSNSVEIEVAEAQAVFD